MSCQSPTHITYQDQFSSYQLTSFLHDATNDVNAYISTVLPTLASISRPVMMPWCRHCQWHCDASNDSTDRCYCFRWCKQLHCDVEEGSDAKMLIWWLQWKQHMPIICTHHIWEMHKQLPNDSHFCFRLLLVSQCDWPHWYHSTLPRFMVTLVASQHHCWEGRARDKYTQHMSQTWHIFQGINGGPITVYMSLTINHVTRRTKYIL